MAKHKYKINHQISLLPRTVSINDIVKILEKSGITKFTFYRDRNMEVKSKTSIPTDRLLKYAELFECTIDDLLTDDKGKGKSLRQQLAKKSFKKINHGLS